MAHHLMLRKVRALHAYGQKLHCPNSVLPKKAFTVTDVLKAWLMQWQYRLYDYVWFDAEFASFSRPEIAVVPSLSCIGYLLSPSQQHENKYHVMHTIEMWFSIFAESAVPMHWLCTLLVSIDVPIPILAKPFSLEEGFQIYIRKCFKTTPVSICEAKVKLAIDVLCTSPY